MAQLPHHPPAGPLPAKPNTAISRRRAAARASSRFARPNMRSAGSSRPRGNRRHHGGFPAFLRIGSSRGNEHTFVAPPSVGSPRTSTSMSACACGRVPAGCAPSISHASRSAPGRIRARIEGGDKTPAKFAGSSDSDNRHGVCVQYHRSAQHTGISAKRAFQPADPTSATEFPGRSSSGRQPRPKMTCCPLTNRASVSSASPPGRSGPRISRSRPDDASSDRRGVVDCSESPELLLWRTRPARGRRSAAKCRRKMPAYRSP